MDGCNLFSLSLRADIKFYSINEYLRKAREALLEKKSMDVVYDFLQKADNELLILKKENNILDINKDLLKIYNDIEAVSESPDKKSATKSLLKLKYDFAFLKQYEIDNEYLIMLDKIEQEIIKLDKSLDGPDYENAQEKLLKYFLELYDRY